MSLRPRPIPLCIPANQVVTVETWNAKSKRWEYLPEALHDARYATRRPFVPLMFRPSGRCSTPCLCHRRARA
jgi:hypothetical protein